MMLFRQEKMTQQCSKGLAHIFCALGVSSEGTTQEYVRQRYNLKGKLIDAIFYIFKNFVLIVSV